MLLRARGQGSPASQPKGQWTGWTSSTITGVAKILGKVMAAVLLWLAIPTDYVSPVTAYCGDARDPRPLAHDNIQSPSW